MSYVSFGDVCRKQLGMQCQYGSRYVNPAFSKEYPYFGEGLRIKGNPNDYHSLEIHEQDVALFVERVKAHRVAQGY